MSQFPPSGGPAPYDPARRPPAPVIRAEQFQPIDRSAAPISPPPMGPSGGSGPEHPGHPVGSQPPPSPRGATGIALVQIGDIVVTGSVISTPYGQVATRDASITAVHRTHSYRATPTWAIVLAIAGFFVVTVFSLFFLLAKETRTTGTIEVTVDGPGLHHSCPVPVASTAAAQDISQRVAYADSVIASARRD